MTRVPLALLLLLVFVARSPAAPSPARPVAGRAGGERYRVHAQHRGPVKKTFDNLGTVTLRFVARGERGGTLEIEGSVRDPEDEGATYRIAAFVDLERWRSKIKTRLRGSFGDGADEARDRLLEIVPFVFYLRTEPFPALGGAAEVAYRIDEKDFRVRYADGERGVEATVYEGLRTVGKLFFRPGPAAGRHDIDRFRVNSVRRSVLSFVRE